MIKKYMILLFTLMYVGNAFTMECSNSECRNYFDENILKIVKTVFYKPFIKCKNCNQLTCIQCHEPYDDKHKWCEKEPCKKLSVYDLSDEIWTLILSNLADFKSLLICTRAVSKELKYKFKNIVPHISDKDKDKDKEDHVYFKYMDGTTKYLPIPKTGTIETLIQYIEKIEGTNIRLICKGRDLSTETSRDIPLSFIRRKLKKINRLHVVMK